MAGRSVVVTGAAQGIGHACVETLVEDGWYVVGIDWDETTLAALETKLGSGGAVISGDVAERGALEQAARRACESAPLAGWVNNAAVSERTTAHDPDPAVVERIISTNVEGVFWGSATAVQTFVRQGSPGAIVNVSSVHAHRGFAGWAAYDMSKGAVEALTRYLAVEYGPVGIRANAVAPGTVRTPNYERHLAAARDRTAAEREQARVQPLRRIAEPHEIASVVRFLLGEESSFVTGTTIVADGGLTAAAFPQPLASDLAAAYGLVDPGAS